MMGEGGIQRQAQGCGQGTGGLWGYAKVGTERMTGCIKGDTEASLGHFEYEGPGGPGATCEEASRR